MDKQRLQDDWGYLIEHAGKGETDDQLAEWFSAEEISLLRLYEEHISALEAVEKLREALKDRMSIYYAKDVPHQSDHPHCRCRSCVNARTHEALAATEPATVELPKCGHCGAIACGTDCDGSSHYTADCHT